EQAAPGGEAPVLRDREVRWEQGAAPGQHEAEVLVMSCRLAKPIALLLVAAALTAAVLPARALADVDPANCTPDLQYDPTIPTYNATLGLPLGGGRPGSQDRQTTAILQAYQHAVARATESNPRV